MRRRRTVKRSFSWALPEKVVIGFRYFFWAGLFLATILIVVISIRVIKEWDQRNWYGKEPLRILVINKPKQAKEPTGLAVVSVFPDTKKAFILNLDPEIQVPVVGGYGTYRLGALLELGRVEGVGTDILVNSLELLLAVPVHVVHETTTGNGLAGTRNQVMKEALGGQVSMAEALEVWNLMAQIDKSKIEEVPVNQKNVVQSKTEADGSTVQYFEAALIDNLMTQKLAARWAEAAALQVAVVNATGKAFMASTWSRFPRVSGFDVVSVTDQQELVGETTILVGEDFKKTPEMLILRSLFPLAQVKSGDVSAYRSDVAVILGMDLWQWAHERDAYLKNSAY